MREITDPQEIAEYQEELLEARKNEQEENDDYDYDEYGNMETCEDCHSLINSHGHCPRCDY